MQRNMDLVRAILIRIEGSPSGWIPPHFGLQGFSPDEIAHHAHIMMQDSLIERIDMNNSDRPSAERIPLALTWKGHEFLDLARDPERWSRAKAIIAKVGSAPISLWMKVLTDLTLQGVNIAATRNG